MGQLGIFRDEGVTQRQIVLEEADGTLNLLPTVPPGGPPTLANRTQRRQRGFVVPHIPHDDVILPQDIQGIHAFGATDAADPLAQLMERRLARMRMKHAQTLEFMRVNALRGQLRDGAGAVLYDWHAEFGITRKTVDFVLGTAGTEVAEKCREVLGHMETNLRGGARSSGPQSWSAPEFWDKLVKHASVKDAYRTSRRPRAASRCATTCDGASPSPASSSRVLAAPSRCPATWPSRWCRPATASPCRAPAPATPS